MALPKALGLAPKDETTEKAEKFVDALTKDVDKRSGGSKKH